MSSIDQCRSVTFAAIAGVIPLRLLCCFTKLYDVHRLVMEASAGRAGINKQLGDDDDAHVRDAGDRPHGRSLAEHREDLGALGNRSLFMAPLCELIWNSLLWVLRRQRHLHRPHVRAFASRSIFQRLELFDLNKDNIFGFRVSCIIFILSLVVRFNSQARIHIWLNFDYIVLLS